MKKIKTIKKIIVAVLLIQVVACKTIKLNDTPIIDGVDSDSSNIVKTVDLINGNVNNNITDLSIPSKDTIVNLIDTNTANEVITLDALKKEELAKLEALKNSKARTAVDLAQFKTKSIYFDFDNFSVRQSDEESIKEHASFLQKNLDYKLTLQGHTDERGGREYNLALGQKRSEAVRQFLAIMGVGDEQLEAISFGEEKPQEKSHNEKAWQENRRVDFYYE